MIGQILLAVGDIMEADEETQYMAIAPGANVIKDGVLVTAIDKKCEAWIEGTLDWPVCTNRKKLAHGM